MSTQVRDNAFTVCEGFIKQLSCACGFGCKSTESDLAVVEVFSAVASSSGAQEECIAKEDVASMYTN